MNLNKQIDLGINFLLTNRFLDKQKQKKHEKTGKIKIGRKRKFTKDSY